MNTTIVTSSASQAPTSASPPSNRMPKKKKTSLKATDTAVDHAMRYLGIGIDTARYGHHVTFLREDKQPACPPLTVMETRTGYEQLRTQIEKLHQRFPNAQIYLRIDAAGQYAANLENFLRSLTHLPISISVGEPKRNKDYHSAYSPKTQSDATESHAMARYAVVERPDESHGTPPQFAVLRRVASRLQSQTKQSTRLINQLHETLSASFPELATLINDLAANWVLCLLEKYPTAKRLAAARLTSIAKIKFIPKDMAEKLFEAAKHSVGTLSGEVAEALIVELVSELQHSLAEEKRWRELLAQAFDALPDGAHKQIATIKGIGKQTAAAIVATSIDIQRFETDKQFTGYFGVFPTELQSGVDKFGRPIPAGKKIMCRKGNDMVRGLLWQCAKCASAVNGGNPAVRALYARRLAAGDSADEKTETPGPKLETHKESACEEVTEMSASLEPVAAKAEPEVNRLPSQWFGSRLTSGYCVSRSRCNRFWKELVECPCRASSIAARARSMNHIRHPAGSFPPISSGRCSAVLILAVASRETCWISGKPSKSSTCTKPPKTSPEPLESPFRTCHSPAKTPQKTKEKNLAGITRPALDLNRYI